MAEVEQALAEYLREGAKAKFDWRSRNCHVFAADWVVRMSGVDPGADFRGRCGTARGALRVMHAAGFTDLAGCTAARMKAAGFAEIEPMVASLGDVGIIMTVGLVKCPQQTLAICAKSGWAALAPRGLMIAKGRAERVWSLNLA